MNRSVTCLDRHAAEVSKRLGGIINGGSFFNPVIGEKTRVVTVLNQHASIKRTPAFRKLRQEGKIVSAIKA